MPNTQSPSQDGKASRSPVSSPLKGELLHNGNESVDSNIDAHENRLVEDMQIPSTDSTKKLLEKKEYPKDMQVSRKSCQLNGYALQQCEGFVRGTVTLRPKMDNSFSP